MVQTAYAARIMGSFLLAFFENKQDRKRLFCKTALPLPS